MVFFDNRSSGVDFNLVFLSLVLVYRCAGLANNCGFCLELDEKYQCGWCQQGETCEVQEHCAVNTMWLDRQQICPNPMITDFYPKSGPTEGGTNLTIEGINLGRVFEDIEHGIVILIEVNGKQVGRVPCIPFPEEYVKTSRIKCRLQSTYNITLLPNNHGIVVVNVSTDYSASSEGYFDFVNPRILTVKPPKGPKSGGTLLSLEGLHMNAGSKAEAFVGDFPCKIERRFLNYAECITSESPTPGEKKVRVRFDNHDRMFEYYEYLYAPDPIIDHVGSGNGRTRSDPRGIPSGGFLVYVKGKDLNIIQAPKMYVEVDGEIFSSNCSDVKAMEMTCETPAVPVEKLDFTWSDKEYIELDYGFIMDNVRSVRSLTTRSDKPFPKFRMYRDPEFTEFNDSERVKDYRSEYLTIKVC